MLSAKWIWNVTFLYEEKVKPLLFWYPGIFKEVIPFAHISNSVTWTIVKGSSKSEILVSHSLIFDKSQKDEFLEKLSL